MGSLLPHLDAVVSPDGARLGVGRVGLAQHHSAGLHSVQTLPHLSGGQAVNILHTSVRARLKIVLMWMWVNYHGDHRPRAHVFDQAGEEGPLLQVCVVLLEKLHFGLQHNRKTQQVQSQPSSRGCGQTCHSPPSRQAAN